MGDSPRSESNSEGGLVYAPSRPAVKENVEQGAHVYTDELKSYFQLQSDYAHDVINHSEVAPEALVGRHVR